MSSYQVLNHGGYSVTGPGGGRYHWGMHAPAIEVVDVARSFRGRKRAPEQAVVALAGVSLTVPAGELFGLLGPNGAGKTTLIKILVTLLLPSSGTARVAGYDVETEPGQVRRRIAIVSGGETTGFGMLTCAEQLWMFSQFHGMRSKEARRRIGELLDVLGIGGARDRKVNDLSTGMRQRLNLARGLLTDPEVLFLDEPTVGLDVEAARDLRAYIRRWMGEGEGRTILLTTHYLAEADELCDRVAIIDGGRILACDTPATLRRAATAGSRYEIRTAAVPEPGWQARLPGLRGASVEATGEGATVTVELAAAGDVVALVGALAPWLILGVNRVEPSLEDVFVEILNQTAPASELEAG